MRYCQKLNSATNACSRACRLIVGLSVLASWPVVAQVSRAMSERTTFEPETLREVNSGAATLVEHYNPNQMLRLTIGLQPPHVAEERQFIEELQTPGKKVFHQFLSAEEWTRRFDPSVEDEQAVVDWATAQGLTVTRRFPNRLIVDVEARAATIEKAFSVTMNRYQLGTKTFFSNDRDPVVPSNLVGIIRSVGGLQNLQVMQPANKNLPEPAFPDYSPGPAVSTGPSGHASGDRSKLPQSLKASRLRSSQKSSVAGSSNYSSGPPYDPQDMYSTAAYSVQALYNLGHCCNPLGNPGGSPPETTIAIATAGTQQVSDMVGFHNTYPYLAYDFGEINIDGTPVCCDGEGTMDLEWSTAMSNSFGNYQNTATVYMYDGVDSGFGTFNDIYNTMLTDGYARNFSTSWGWIDATLGGGNMATADAIFTAMVGQGWSLTAASGDGGASYSCQAFDSISFPASDPNVVAAGGATLYMFGGPPPIFNSLVAWSGGPDGCGTNDGGSTGGYSAYWSTPSYQSSLGLSSRGNPDLALNADWYNTPQWLYFGGGLGGNGGTSIVAPETAGFFAQENAYLLALGNICGASGSSPCAPMGAVNPYLYSAGAGGARSNPFYDVTSGCNNNDITALYSLGYYCAGAGWDPVTGWGVYNFLQLAWAINWLHVPGYSFPVVNFSSSYSTNTWYNSDPYVTWTVSAPAESSFPSPGTSGFSQEWDGDPGNPTSEATPGYSGFPSSPYNAFYDGPQYPNATSGCLDLVGLYCASGIGGVQGWHTVNIRAWGNEGENSYYAYGPIGYDTLAPTSSANVSGTVVGGNFENSATVTLTASDPGFTASPQTGSGVANTYYQLNGGTLTTYTGSVGVSKDGPNTVNFYSTDRAGNVESTKSVNFGITASTTLTLTSSKDPSFYGGAVVFKAVVTPAITGPATGNVVFKDGATVLATHALIGGKATLSIATLTVGTHSITATFQGSTYFLASGPATVSQVVENYYTTTALASTVNPAVFGQSVTFTAAITSVGSGETGTVTFKSGAVVMATTAVSAGMATFSTSALTVSVAGHPITAVYSGDSNFIGSTSPVLKQIVTKADSSTSVVSTLNPSNHGQTVTFTATVVAVAPGAGTPSGPVQFKDGATLLGSRSLAGGVAAFSTSALASGSHNITANYAGSAHFNASASPVLVQVVQ
jgi:hypothetical protein